MSEPDPTPSPDPRPLPLDYRKPAVHSRLTLSQLVARVILTVIGVLALAFLILLGTCALMR